MVEAVIFDADDTLWKTEPIYDKVLDQLQMEICSYGLDGIQWRILQRHIDIDAVDSMGFSRKRFPSSSVEAYRQLTIHYDPQIANRIYELSESVFDMKATLVAGALDTLTNISHSFRLGLITKGDISIQHKRIRDSGFTNFFEFIAIVQKKNSAKFSSACKILDLHPSEVVSVGNSLRSDLMPAIEAGMHAIWIDADVWEHERSLTSEFSDSIVELKNLNELPEALMRLTSSVR